MEAGPQFRLALAQVRRRDPLRLAAGADAIPASTLTGSVIERKVPLPERWLRAFPGAQVITATFDLRPEGTRLRCTCQSFEVKYGAKCDVDLHEFLRAQAAREVTEALRVDGGGLLDQYPDVLAEEFDGGMDHGSEGLGRRGGHEPR